MEIQKDMVFYIKVIQYFLIYINDTCFPEKKI